MSRIRRASYQKSFLTHSGDNMPSALMASVWDQQSQERQTNQVVANGSTVPKGMKAGDITARLTPGGGIGIGVSDSRGTVREAVLQKNISAWLPDQVGTGVPTVVHFPKSGQFGWYEDSAGPTLYWARNRNGTILKVALT